MDPPNESLGSLSLCLCVARQTSRSAAASQRCGWELDPLNFRAGTVRGYSVQKKKNKIKTQNLLHSQANKSKMRARGAPTSQTNPREPKQCSEGRLAERARRDATEQTTCYCWFLTRHLL